MADIMFSKNENITEPDGTQTRISRCTDQQVLPVSIFTKKDFISFSVYRVNGRFK